MHVGLTSLQMMGSPDIENWKCSKYPNETTDQDMLPGDSGVVLLVFYMDIQTKDITEMPTLTNASSS
jgi:hypothetical protein